MHPVIAILTAPLVITTAIAVHANAHPDTALAQWWLRANANIRAAKQAKNATKDDVTIVIGDK